MDKTRSQSQLYKYGSVALLVAAAIFLFFAQSAYWINHTIFNQENFSRTTTKSLLSEPSRNAIATSIVNKSLSDKPLAEQVVGERAVPLISGLLGSDLSNQIVSSLSSKTYAYITSPNRQEIKLDLTAVKDPLTEIISVAQQNGKLESIDKDKIPDTVILVRENSFPNFSSFIQTMLWIAPLLWLGTITLFSLYIYIGRKEYVRRVYFVGLSIAIVAILGLLTSPFIPPPIAAALPNIELRPVAQSLTSGFLASFNTQMYYMLGFVIVALGIFHQRLKILSFLKDKASK